MQFSRLILTALLSLGLAAPAWAAEEVKINGSTTVLPIVQKTSEAFMKNNPGMVLTISGTGSGNGIKALLDNLCTIAMASRDIKSGEIKLAEKKKITPVRHVVGIDALVPVIHKDNPVKDLTVEQLSAIYTGKIKNWKEVGGKNSPIAVVSRETSSGTYETWQGKIVGKGNLLTPAALTAASNGAMVQAVSKNPNALGYIGYGYVDGTTKVLSIGGFEANAESALGGNWPIARELYLFTNGEPTGPSKAYIDFVLSADGQKLVKEVGFIPLAK